MRAIDIHVHPPTPEWLDGSLRGYTEAAERYFRSPVARRSIEELARYYRGLEMMAVLLAWDAERATERPRLPNSVVAEAVRDNPDVFAGFGSTDPHRGQQALEEAQQIAELGLRGVKFHPSIQAFDPSDERWWPLFERCRDLGLVCLFHTGTSGLGAGQPGGQGIRLDYCQPIKLDPVAAAFPDLQIVAAHFGYPWHLELLAMALHKTNLWIDISGWAPRYIPAEVWRELRGRLQDRFLFGSDLPFIEPERCLLELEAMELSPEVRGKLLLGNAQRLLGLEVQAAG